jgi:hypothetical protein
MLTPGEGTPNITPLPKSLLNEWKHKARFSFPRGAGRAFSDIRKQVITFFISL